MQTRSGEEAKVTFMPVVDLLTVPARNGQLSATAQPNHTRNCSLWQIFKPISVLIRRAANQNRGIIHICDVSKFQAETRASGKSPHIVKTFLSSSSLDERVLCLRMPRGITVRSRETLKGWVILYLGRFLRTVD